MDIQLSLISPYILHRVDEDFVLVLLAGGELVKGDNVVVREFCLVANGGVRIAHY